MSAIRSVNILADGLPKWSGINDKSELIEDSPPKMIKELKEKRKKEKSENKDGNDDK